MDNEDKAALADIGAANGVSATAGNVTVLIATTKTLGITMVATTVALPVAGIIATGGLLTYGGS